MTDTRPVSPNNDGWCGERCPSCHGTGYGDDEGRSCQRCGGTGERYESNLDLRPESTA